MNLWDLLINLYLINCSVYWCILDGADINRQFIKIHFTGEQEAVAHNFVAHNMYYGYPMVFIMDPKVYM